ncbi:ATP-binding protein [Teichococcus rhizosphaerae]|uniref:ATP-binding protein n=1 Tax=Teichococcus rhizosphaerae TaxID=1335062 RepID=UPI00159BD544|nr:ATP-binding protein [Pseudoroseomonas rhizosphaerae]
MDDPAPDFIFEPERPITLFEGWNGSGKTSLANAVVWCLTGKLLRSQRLPEGGDKEYACEVERGAEEEVTQHTISPVTPLPTGQHWTPDRSERTVPADTWVELTFVGEDGIRLPPIRRTQSRTPNGKLVEEGPSASDLGLDLITFSLGTTMPGMLPYLQVGSQSELGQAVARLTGLSDLVDLARHATRAKARIRGDLTRQRGADLERVEADFLRHRRDLEERISEFPSMAPTAPLPSADGPAEDLTALEAHFEGIKAESLAHAREVLGDTFDAAEPGQRRNLEASIVPAMEQMRRLSQLQSMERLASLRLEAGPREELEDLICRLLREAQTLEELAADPVLKRRTQLYARVTAWMHEHGHADDGKCAVCQHSLAGVLDAETGSLVSEHLDQVARDSEVLSRTVAQWEEAWTGRLARDLPPSLRRELDRDLPASPATLLRTAMTEELFATEGFAGALSSLRPGVEALTSRALELVPPFAVPALPSLPTSISAATPTLSVVLRRVRRALAFSDWMSCNRPALLQALNTVRTGFSEDEAIVGLDAQLSRLDLIVKGVAPINAATELVRRLVSSRAERTSRLKAIEDCRTAAQALDEIIPIGALATAQVEGLQRRLHGRAEHWRNAIYQNATTFSPEPRRTGMTPQGVIDIHVGRDGVHAPAQHVSNASALRASLLGFYLAFREHVMRTSGGLALVVLDDPQDLLDYDNRQRLARALTALAAGGAQILTTTHDRSFARVLVAEARSGNQIEHRSIHPVNASRRTLETSLAIEDLDRKRSDFIANPDSAPHAQDYANQARIFLEARLGDLFDDPAYPAFSAPSDSTTLMPLYDRLRGLVSGRSNELFRSPVLAKFCADAALAEGAAARRVLNQSHHRDRDALSYVEVQQVDADLRRLRSSVERVHEEFRRYRWREPLENERIEAVARLTGISAPPLNVPIVQDIAAFSGHVPSGGSQDSSVEMFTSAWFANKALFYVRYDTMGFAIPSGSVAIVEATPSAPRDHDLVVARRGRAAFARRLLRPRNGEGFSLAAEATDPRQGKPTLAFEDRAAELHRVVGVLFSQLPPPDGREEATLIGGDPTLARIEVAYRVREDSAVPRAMPGQIILGGAVISPERLDAMEGAMVAVTLEDGDSILKRVGAQLSRSLPYLRQFETIGGLGASVVIATERVEGAPDVPVMLNARPVLGVIYQP